MKFLKKQRDDLIEAYADQFEAGIFPNHREFQRDTAACALYSEIINLTYEEIQND